MGCTSKGKKGPKMAPKSSKKTPPRNRGTGGTPQKALQGRTGGSMRGKAGY